MDVDGLVNTRKLAQRCIPIALLALAFPAVAAPSAAELCALLRPADFEAAGIPGTGAPSVTPDTSGAYCLYAGKSSAAGGVELDVFAARGPKDATEIYTTMRGDDSAATHTQNALAGADQSDLRTVPGPQAFTAIAVRKGKLVFSIGVPTTAKSQDAVVSLARLVLQRANRLAR